MLIEALQKQSGVERSKLERIAQTASQRYKTYQIEKRSGGFRTIEHPSRDLKAIQRWLNAVLFKRMSVHEYATAYKAGASITKNAEFHSASNFTLRIDFKAFFPSFKITGVSEFLSEKNVEYKFELDARDVAFVCAIVCKNGRLTIGAPSSPILTNAMMFDFDRELVSRFSPRNLTYTRYADDLFVSALSPFALDNVAGEIEAIASSYKFAELVVNVTKTANLSRRYRRTVTGLVVTTDRKLSIGRDRKRKIKALVFDFKRQTLAKADLPYLQGILGFAKGAEPEFYEALRRKYGSAVLAAITKA